MNICIITASEIKNLELAHSFRTGLEGVGAQVSLVNLVDMNLPLYSSRTEKDYKGEELLKDVLEDISNSKGMIFIAPEYNGSTPPVFNNFLAWLSRSSKHWRDHLNGKPAAIATYSGGGGFNVLMVMRAQLAFIGMNVLGRQILTHANKALDPATLSAVCNELLRFSQIPILKKD